MRVKFLESENIFIAPLNLSDAAACYQWFIDPAIRRYLSSSALVNTLEKSKEFIASANCSRTTALFGIFHNEGGVHIGNVELQGIDLINRNASVGIAIGEKSYLGRGFGRETMELILGYAFGTLGLNMIFLNVFADNARAIASYEKCGFKKRGSLPQCFYRDGAYIDCVIMSITKDEYKSSGR
ncbi:MAG: GCN5-related N-acetyltransferase [uncultured bacterium]|uniref:N-acetyltransferase domain-containing protein n=1 Tax=Candidatus Wallbacteria bacterium GWC2_49_35 TaxID=1817813 RepID=A0A1F7WSK9_9BACT|nr:MAG: GCN5-related N-acetyltransferase [uncultured bacterium]OGM05730.1 MAG: hypothetical protein A2008_08115 [Candidatus Wallbacteria bacterium GWC2_49_35]HBC74783.1 GNAT family N-acetyltransferase [Candidatus Wallbacteria bacterium]